MIAVYATANMFLKNLHENMVFVHEALSSLFAAKSFHQFLSTASAPSMDIRRTVEDIYFIRMKLCTSEDRLRYIILELQHEKR